MTDLQAAGCLSLHRFHHRQGDEVLEEWKALTRHRQLHG